MDQYHMLHIIGQGCFGKVFKGRRRYSGQIVALKFISKRGKPEKDLRNLRLEIGILQRLDHPNIIRMLDSFETSSDFVVVTEFAYGELFEIFQDDKHLPEDEVRHVAQQLVQALNYIHMQKIIHRDMKPQNVLVGANETIKLCDFGFARAMSCETIAVTSIKGTPLYMAPELVQEKPYDCSADLWSLGVICYELFVGQPPFYTNSLISLIHLIVQTPVQYPENMSLDFKSMLQGLLQKNPKQRLGWPDLLHHPFIANRRTTPASNRQTRKDQGSGAVTKTHSATPPAQPAQVAPVATAPLGNLKKLLPVFVELLTGPPQARGGERAAHMFDDTFANFCLSALKAYADVLEDGLLIISAPHFDYQGVHLSLVGEPQEGQLALSPLVRSLAQVLGSPPPNVVQCLCTMAFLLLRIVRVLSGSQAELYGPPWDLVSDILRLLGICFRAPIALGVGVADELLKPNGPLMQYVALVPVLIIGGTIGQFCVQNSWFAGRTNVHHLGTAVNAVKCFGVVSSHLAQAAATYPPSGFVIDLFQCLADSCIGSQEKSPVTETDLAHYNMKLAIHVVCQCVLFRSAVGSPGERLMRSALQATAALLHGGQGGLARAGVPWGGDAAQGFPSVANEGGRLHAAIRGVREAVRRSLRDVISEAMLCPPGSGEVDHAVIGLLWSLRTTPGGERLDASALKVLVGLISLSLETAQKLAEHQGVADSLMPDRSMGPGAALAVVEATCAGAADQNPGVAWPAVGLLLSVLMGSLRPCGDLPYVSLGILDRPAHLVQPPSWCTPSLVYALALRLQSSLSSPLETVLTMLCATYAFEFLATVCAALIQHHSIASAQLPVDLMRAVSPIEHIFDRVLVTLSRGRIGRQCLDDIRKAEGVFYGYVMRGPLDGVIGMSAVHHALENLRGNESLLAKNTVQFLLGEDPQAILSVVGPSGLLRMLDLLYCFRDAVEPSVGALRFCLSLLWALQSLCALPNSDVIGLPHLAASFHAGTDLTLRIFGTVSQANVMAGSTELHADFQDSKAIAAVMQLLEVIPNVDPMGWQALQDVWWRALSSGLQLLSTLVLHHHTLAHEFVQCEGVKMLVNRKLLSLELARADASASQLVIDALLIVSQLSRLSKEYYPMLHKMSLCSDLRDLLGCNNSSIRAKACNAIGNMARHSDFFYTTMQQSGILPQLIVCCSDSDSTCRKFSSFAVGNSAFHSDVLYKDLASAVPRLVSLLKDDDEKTRANSAGAIGNLVRNSTELCGVMIKEGALQGLFNLVESRIPRRGSDVDVQNRFVADSSIKIALFSLGNLAMHSDCRAAMETSLKIGELCHQLTSCCSREEVTYKYAQRLLQKLNS